MHRIFCLFFIIFIPAVAVSQNTPSRGSIPDILLRPGRGESPRYPADIVIGEIGRGAASDAAYSYANTIGTGLILGQREHPAFSSVSPADLESYFSALRVINPASFRIGSGRNEADGSVSFLIRFIGREQGITGELYIRYVTRQITSDDGEIGNSVPRTIGSWVFEDLFLDEAAGREAENQRSIYINDFYPYERFY